jgi:hypothetical protein
MRNISKSLVLGFFLAVLGLPILHAQPAPGSHASNPAAAQTTPAAQAPDELLKKLSDLVHAGKYAEAQQLTAGLLLAYPDDQRLIKTKALLDQSLATGGAADASPSVALPSSNSPSAPPPSSVTPEQLTGMDKIDYSALLELAREAQQNSDLPEQTKLLQQFMEQSAQFLRKHPDQMLLWQLRAASAISLQAPLAGYDAAQKLLAADAANSNDPNVLQLLTKLKLLGWLDAQQVRALQLSADNERAQQAAAASAEQRKAESAKFTFPVAHSHAFSYSYGHMTVNEDDAVYVADDETIHLAKSDIRELKVLCVANNMCGLYFYPKDGRKFFFLAVTEYAVANKTLEGKVVFPPSVIGNAVVARWKYVSTDQKTLSPPPPAQNSASASAAQAPAAQPARSVEAASNSALQPLAPASELEQTFASAVPAREPSAKTENSSAPAPAEKSAAPSATSSTTVLHVYRPHHLTGASQQPYIYIDGKQITTIANSQDVRMLLAPGKHTISVFKKYIDSQVPINDLPMAAGGEYWVRLEISAGAWGGHAKLYVVPSEQARDESKEMKEVRIDDVSMN